MADSVANSNSHFNAKKCPAYKKGTTTQCGMTPEAGWSLCRYHGDHDLVNGLERLKAGMELHESVANALMPDAETRIIRHPARRFAWEAPAAAASGCEIEIEHALPPAAPAPLAPAPVCSNNAEAMDAIAAAMHTHVAAMRSEFDGQRAAMREAFDDQNAAMCEQFKCDKAALLADIESHKSTVAAMLDAQVGAMRNEFDQLKVTAGGPPSDLKSKLNVLVVNMEQLAAQVRQLSVRMDTAERGIAQADEACNSNFEELGKRTELCMTLVSRGRVTA